MKRIRAGALCSLLVIVVPLFGQTFERVLLPLALESQPVPGAFGSQWVTDLVVTNMSEEPLFVERDMEVNIGVPAPPLPPHATAFVHLTGVSSLVRGALLAIDEGRSDDLAMTLRSRDISRQAETWGTVIPVVTRGQLYGTLFGLSDIPMNIDFRATLRLYDVNAETPPHVRVRFYGIDPDQFPTGTDSDTLIKELEPAFSLPLPGERELFPASAELALASDPELANIGRMRIEIEPLDGVAEYWGFVSITHNQTQHVTVISPR